MGAFCVMLCGVLSVVDDHRYSEEATYTLIIVLALLIPLTVIRVLRKAGQKAGQKATSGKGYRTKSFDFKQRTIAKNRIALPTAWGATATVTETTNATLRKVCRE